MAEALVLAEVFVADVQPAGERDLAVHDQDLAVVPQVDLNAAAEQVDGQEGSVLARRPGGASAAATSRACATPSRRRAAGLGPPVSPSPRAGRGIAGPIVVLENEELEVDVVLGRPNGGEHVVERRLAFGVERELVAARDRVRVKPPGQPAHALPGVVRVLGLVGFGVNGVRPAGFLTRNSRRCRCFRFSGR